MMLLNLKTQYLNHNYSWITVDIPNAKRIVKYLRKNKIDFISHWNDSKTKMIIILDGSVSLDRMERKVKKLRFNMSKVYMDQREVRDA